MSRDHFRLIGALGEGRKKLSHVINAKKDVRGAKASLTFT